MTAFRKWTIAMLVPSLVPIAVFVLVPIGLTLALSLTKWSSQTPFSSASFVGLANFAEIFGSSSVGRDFKGALVNTALYSALSIALILPLSIGFGMLVHQAGLKGAEVLRTVLFATYMVPMIAVALVFSKLYSPSEGPINQLLGFVGVPPQTWLSSPDTALVSIVLLNVWQQVGYFTILIIAGLTQIPQSIYDAAKIDGARGARLFGFITLPLLKRTLLFSGVIALINAVQVFEPVALITQGGPAGSTNVLTYHIRRVGIERAQGGLGSAMSVTLLLALAVTVTAVFAFARRERQS